MRKNAKRASTKSIPANTAPSLKLTKGNITAIIIAAITGICTIIAACIGLGNPVITRLFEKSKETQVPPGFTLTATSLSASTQIQATPTQITDSIRLDSVSVEYGACLDLMYAVPESISIPPQVSGSNPFERYAATNNYLDEVGFHVAAKSVNPVENEGYVPSPCDPNLGISTVIWNNQPDTILVKEFALIVEAYDYEPSAIPDDHKLVFVIPPQLGGGVPAPTDEAAPIPYQFFTGELRATSNSLPFLNMSDTPPIAIQPGSLMNFSVFLYPVSGGTFRMHLAFYIGDSQGNEIDVNSEGFISKWVSIDVLDSSIVTSIDVR